MRKAINYCKKITPISWKITPMFYLCNRNKIGSPKDESRKADVITFCIFMFFGYTSSAQPYPDAGLWNTFSLEYKINSRFSATLDEELRLNENFSRIDLFYTNLGIAYKASDFLKFALIYRAIQKFRIDNTVSFRNRLMFDIVLRKKLEPFIFSCRTRFQSEVRNYYSSETGKIPEYYMRNKFEIKYALNQSLSPYLSAEFRYQFDNIREDYANGLYHRIRPALGFDYELNKKNSFGLYYLIQHEWNVPEPEEFYIIGLEYSLTL